MVPFVLPAADTRLFIHVSMLASHTRDMQEHPRVSLLVMAELSAGLSPQALPRVALQANALTWPRNGAGYLCRADVPAIPLHAVEEAAVDLRDHGLRA